MAAEIQQAMQAIEIRDGALRETRRPVPAPGPGEVLIRVAAAGVNRADLLQRQGKYPPPPGASDLPGLEASGHIVETGEKVCVLLPGGGYAEYVTAPRDLCLPVPGTLPLAHAAALPEAVFTVWKNLFILGGLRAGQTALIHGGASGVGTSAIAMARIFGARALVTAGGAEKCAACRDLGADLAVDYKSGDFVAAIQDFTGGRGVDVVLDMVGGDYVARDFEILTHGGRHVSIAWQGGAKAEIPLPVIMKKNLILTGSTLRDRPLAEKAALANEIREKVWPRVMDGTLIPRIFRSFPLTRAGEALALLESGGVIGKLILEN